MLRGGRRVPSVFTLTFLPVDGLPATHNWRRGRATLKEKRRVNLRTADGQFESYDPSRRVKLTRPNGVKVEPEETDAKYPAAKFLRFPPPQTCSYAPSQRGAFISTGSEGASGADELPSGDDAASFGVSAHT